MSNNPAASAEFIISAADPILRCPVLQARFTVADVGKLRTILKLPADEDLRSRNYWLEPSELAEVLVTFNVGFDPKKLANKHCQFALFVLGRSKAMPYLVHGGYELFLLLDGHKKMAMFAAPYPPKTFEGEENFDRAVAEGKLHREEIVELANPSLKQMAGIRTVYYTLKGEEWRIPARKLIWQASAKAGGWNEYFERLEGMLLGYEDWENDWWIEHRLRDGGFGAPVCCAITAAGLKWAEAAAFRALPPCQKPTLTVAMYDFRDEAKMRMFMEEDPDSVALVRFAIPLWKARDILPPSQTGERWLVPSDRLPDLNGYLRNPIVVALKRDLPS